MLENLNKNESFEYQKLSPEEMKARGILGRLVGPCADFINPTRNGRGYSEQLWENVFDDDIVKEKISNKCLYGELGHPADREEVDMEKIAISMPEVPKKNKDGKLVACFDILDTPSGRILKTLCDYGTTIGISSRGSGDVVEDDDGNEVVDPSTYNFECFDAVIVPAVKEARLNYVTESLNKTDDLRKALCEDLNSASEEDKKVMQETLDNLGIDVSDTKEQLNEDVSNHVNDEDKEIQETSKQEEVANNDGTENIVKSLQESLKSNLKLETKIEELQNELAVRDTKVSKLEEDLSRSKSLIVRLTTIAKESKEKTKRISSLEEELKQSNEKIETLVNKPLRESKENAKSLNETLAKKENEITSLNEQLSNLKSEHEKEINTLKESLNNEKKQSQAKEKELNESLNKSKKLLEKYKQFSNNVAERYIEVRAKNIGVTKNEILNKLSANYSLEEVDKICEDLRAYKIQVSKLPFALDNKSVVKISESKHIGITNTIVNDDDYVDESLIKLAGVKK